MTERLALGTTVGAVNSAAAATTGDEAGATVLTHRSALRLGTDGSVSFADTTGHHRGVVIDDYLSRVGDPVDLLAADGSTHDAADLFAAATRALTAELRAAAAESDDAATTVACYPAWWPEVTVEAARSALARSGLPEVTLVPEPLAAVRRYEIENGPLDDGALVVYDLGASGSTVTVLRTGEQAGLLGTPVHSTAIAGSEFDLLTMRYVLANALGGNDIDPFDPVVEEELSALRERCRIAKEELSRNTATAIPVGMLSPSVHTEQVRLTRGELEDLLRPTLLDSMSLLQDAVRRADLTLGDVGRVLLTGGGGAIPLVAELISTEFGLPVIACADPTTCTALGAAEIALDIAAISLPTVAIPAVQVASSSVAVAPAVEVLALPAEPVRTKMFTAKRSAVVAAAALTMAALATGTLALGGTTQFSPTGPAATTNAPPIPGAPASTSAGGTAGATNATNSGVTDPALPGATGTATPSGVIPVGTTDAGVPGGTPAAGTPAPAGGAPAAGTPATATPETAGQPGPAAQQPAQAPPAGQAPAPATAPAPGPAPAPAPAPAPVPAPTKPQVPTIQVDPGGLLDDVGGAVGETLESGTQLPGRVLGGNGG
ncbi:Hsp70 family protein [Nocardia salmonicida]|uniref:Hsp70 family protein n=1 Tax=Nocardia salmonicida TaxID=53431 RepID=UPI0007A41184|nr:Hsp70 family protein [Nocardia salmonicida]